MSTATYKESLKQAKNFTVPEQLLKSLAQVFQEAQQTYSGHRKHLAVLKAIHTRAVEIDFEDVFNMAFCRVINKILPVKKNEIVADRAVKLACSFVTNLEDNDHNARFVDHFIHHLLRGIESKDKNVRYRVLQFLSLIVSGLGELEEELYSTLVWEVHKRLFDKEPTVRLKAVLCISRFQEEDAELNDPKSATAKLLHVIQNDASAEVRRAALLNLDPSEKTLPYLMERAKDTNSVNRKLVYSRVIKQIGDFRLLDRSIREKVLLWGLKDREKTVQEAAIKMFCTQWFENVDKDVMELLERLHLIDSRVADIAMKFFMENRSDVVSKIKLDEEYWRRLNVEAAFLARIFYEHCLSHNLQDKIEENFPEAAEFAGYLSKYLKVRKDNIEASEQHSDSTPENAEPFDSKEIDYVILQMLLIAKNYDFSDEIGRREMLQALRMSFYDKLTDEQVNVALQVLKKISINEKDFCQMVSEIIIDIRDEDNEFVLDQEFSPEADQEKIEKHVKRAKQCLMICQHMLELTNEPLRDNIPVTSLLDSVINPAIRSKLVPIREGGVRCLGLCCLLDETLATEQLAFFGICCAKGNEDLQATCLQIIFDILSTHGPKVLDVEGCVDTLSMHKLLFRSLRKSDRPKVQAITAEGLCKLFLNDIFNDEELFETLILAYFNGSNSKNQDLLQALSFCLPAYAFSHVKHQEKFAKVAADAFFRVYANYEEFQSEENATNPMPGPTTILQQLIFWTDPQNLVNATEEMKNTLKHHYVFLYDLLELLVNEVTSKSFKKVVTTNFGKFYISDDLSYEDLNNLYEKAYETNDMIDGVSDGPTRNAMKKLLSILEDMSSAAEAREKNADTLQKDEKDDEEFVSALIGERSSEKISDEEQMEANFGESNGDLVIPDTSLRKIATNSSFFSKNGNSDSEDDKNYEGTAILESNAKDLDDSDDDSKIDESQNLASTTEEMVETAEKDHDGDIIMDEPGNDNDADESVVFEEEIKPVRNTRSSKKSNKKSSLRSSQEITNEDVAYYSSDNEDELRVVKKPAKSKKKN